MSQVWDCNVILLPFFFHNSPLCVYHFTEMEQIEMVQFPDTLPQLHNQV